MSFCPEVQTLSSLIDGDLPAEREVAVHAHLDLCVACRGTLDGLIALKQAVGRAYDSDAPSPALRRAVAAGMVKPRRGRWKQGVDR